MTRRLAAMATVALVGCGGGRATHAGDVCAAELVDDPFENDVRTVVTRLAVDGAYTARVRLRVPRRPPQDGDAYPVALIVHGGWEPDGTAAETESPTAAVNAGLSVIHLDLAPEGAAGDHRGAIARAAVARAMRYAVGLERDQSGCTLQDRQGGGGVDRLVLVGVSNGGNLAVATLADPTLDLPSPTGVVTWETPSAPPFTTVAFGGEPTVYTPGACARGSVQGLDGLRVLCEYPTDLLVGSADGPCFDVDGDGACTDADAAPRGTHDPVSRRDMYDPSLASLLAARGLLPTYASDADTARIWWEERDATALAAQAVTLHPEAPYLLLASEEDHVLPYADHPHVYALGEALQAADAAWTRLNPDADRVAEADDENQPNAPLAMSDPRARVLSEDAENPLDALLSAAVRELVDTGPRAEW
jgi:alpha-beta hydrolase superfamily lysophospholipase